MLKDRRESLRESLTSLTKDVGLRRGAIRNVFRNSRQGRVSQEDHLPSSYTLGDHMEYLHIHSDPGGNHFADVSHLFFDSLLSIPGLVKDFQSPMEEERHLQHLYYGLDEMSRILTPTTTTTPVPPSSIEPLPVRTMTMRLRPDVMTPVVIDAVQEACQQQQPSLTAQVLKRFQGCFQCLLIPRAKNEEAPDAEAYKRSFVLDTRVCTQKRGGMDRILLIRIFYADHHYMTIHGHSHLHPMIDCHKLSYSSGKKNSPSKRDQRMSAKQRRDQAIANIGASSTDHALIIPINLHLRSTASFLQYLPCQLQRQSKQQQEQSPTSVQSPPQTTSPRQQRQFAEQTMLMIPSPKESPKASTTYFVGSFEPTSSVLQLRSELPQPPTNEIFPSLNPDDWALMQTSWPVLSSIWRSLTEHHCLFHTIAALSPEDDPVRTEDRNDESEDQNLTTTRMEDVHLDLHYCSQIRQIVRDTMLAEIRQSFEELQSSSEGAETSHKNFLAILQTVHLKYHMPKIPMTINNISKLLKAPSSVPPIGYVHLSDLVCKCVNNIHNSNSSNNSSSSNSSSSEDRGEVAGNTSACKPVRSSWTARCDDVIDKVYKTFCSHDDHDSRKHLKESNARVMSRLVKIQVTQTKMIKELEDHANTQEAARKFAAELANMAIVNTESPHHYNGRNIHDERSLLLTQGRVPLMEFDLLGGGQCVVTATRMLCTSDRGIVRSLFGGIRGGESGGRGGTSSVRSSLFDLDAVDFQLISSNCMDVLSPQGMTTTLMATAGGPPLMLATEQETLYKLHTSSTDLRSVLQFLRTLQTLQSDLLVKKEDMHHHYQHRQLPPPPPVRMFH